jgi:hypothetical protein
MKVMGRFRFGHYRRYNRVSPAPDRHSLAELMRVPLDDVAAIVSALEPAGIIATARPSEGPDADASLASILVLSDEIDRAELVLRRAGLLSDT